MGKVVLCVAIIEITVNLERDRREVSVICEHYMAMEYLALCLKHLCVSNENYLIASKDTVDFMETARCCCFSRHLEARKKASFMRGSKCPFT